ncbi:E3 ubiquitin protein ligase RIN2 isoform X2 [Manihot esculenta]|uniref:E3 ubiquitin protein ligase RIN2 isoform X2 n=1 Tax=Manihot esculenta TaxID=3983 RepID=UPI000B5D8A35|nr:E3 ubiquitin protein ligase RIN2 isoform X2 [Manihot esculenta]
MGVGYLAISAVSTALSFVGLQCWTELSVDKLKSDGLIISENFISLDNANRALELLLDSYATTGMLANFLFNAFILLNLCLKTIFFVELYPAEARKLMERLINYVVYKGTFLPLVIPATIFQVGLWSIWLIVLCSLKMFQALARDRLERLNASPSAMPWTYFRVYSALLLVLSVDFFWIRLCLVIYKTLNSSIFLLLFFEPFSIAFETMQAMLVHGFQLLDIWLYHSTGNSTNCQRLKFFDAVAAVQVNLQLVQSKLGSTGTYLRVCRSIMPFKAAFCMHCVVASKPLLQSSLSEWKSILIRNLGFSLDMATLLMALGHYMHIWWLHGVALHLVDAVLFLNIRALLSAIIKRVRGYAKLRTALGALHAALPDATSEELRAYDDECAICREPMAKAKKLYCRHLFHLACLRSWLDQGLNELYSCPTCRKPLFIGRPDNEANHHGGDILTDEQLARQLSERLDQQTPPILPAGVFPNQTRASIEGSPWRTAGLDSSWLHAWPGQGVDGAGPSTAVRSVGLGRVQMMMRHLASVGETYAQTALEDAAWTLWPMDPAQAVASGSSVTPTTVGRSGGGSGGLHIRTATRSASDNIVNMLAMVETVREVLPHIPDEVILQCIKLCRTCSEQIL